MAARTLTAGIVMATIPDRAAEAEAAFRVLRPQADSFVVHLMDGWDPPFAADADVVLRHRVRRGPAVRMRSIPTTDVVLFVDDDLVVPPDYVERTIASLKRLGRGTVLTYHVLWWPRESPLDYAACRYLTYSDATDRDVEATVIGVGVSAFWRSDLERVDLPPPEYEFHNDLWTSCAAARAGLRVVRPPTAGGWVESTEATHRGLWTTPGRRERSEEILRELAARYAWDPRI